MQTFLPFPDLRDSARALDYKRLGKQRVETLQILRALTTGGAWSNHPAVRMWRGHRHALAIYGVVVCREWRARGYIDRTEHKIARFLPGELKALHYRSKCTVITLATISTVRVRHVPTRTNYAFALPVWFGRPTFHRAHRSNLKRKDAEYYAQLRAPEGLEYVWPA